MKKDIFWNSIGTAAWSFLSLFLLIVVTRINGIADSGIFSFAFAFAIIMFTVGCYGGRAYQVSDHKNSFTTDDYISLRILTTFGVILLSILFIIANGYNGQKALLILILVGHRVFDALADVFYGILQKKNKLYISGKSLFYKSLLSLSIFYIVDILTHNLLLSSLTLPLVSLLFIIFYDIPRSKEAEIFNIKPRLRDIKQILISTFSPFIIAVMGLVFVNLARYFIDIYHPDLQGYFGIIIMPLSMVVLLFSFISTPALLHLTEQYNIGNFKALNRLVGKIISLTAVATLLLCVFMYYFGAWLLELLFNLSFEQYILDVVLVIIIGLAISITALFTNLAVIARRLKVTAAIYLISNVLLILLCIPLVNHYYIRGAIIAYTVTSCIQAIIMAIYYRRLTSAYKLSRNS